MIRSFNAFSNISIVSTVRLTVPCSIWLMYDFDIPVESAKSCCFSPFSSKIAKIRSAICVFRDFFIGKITKIFEESFVLLKLRSAFTRYTITKLMKSTKMNVPKTLLEAVNYFSNDAICVEFLANLRWEDGKPVCPKCGSKNVCSLTTRPAYRCREKGCTKTFSLKTGSVMEDSPLPITKWVPALWFVINHKNGVSSCEIARALGITQKAAWHMGHRIREAVSNGSFTKLSGTVEIDETFVGGKEQFKHGYKNRRSVDRVGGGTGGKTTVLGMIERGGEFRGKVVENRRRRHLEPEVLANIEEGATVYTDSLMSYYKLKDVYTHEWVDHSKGQYGNGAVHTNTAENFWSCFKRSIKGTYIQIATFHTDRYLDEQAFRYNNRKLDDAGRFMKAASQIFGKKLTYAELTGKYPTCI